MYPQTGCVFVQNGVRKNYIQIGTVMTDEAYRKRGLAKKLMEHVIERHRDSARRHLSVPANLDALDFYRRLDRGSIPIR